jgi:hypothetical protein
LAARCAVKQALWSCRKLHEIHNLLQIATLGKQVEQSIGWRKLELTKPYQLWSTDGYPNHYNLLFVWWLGESIATSWRSAMSDDRHRVPSNVLVAAVFFGQLSMCPPHPGRTRTTRGHFTPTYNWLPPIYSMCYGNIMTKHPNCDKISISSAPRFRDVWALAMISIHHIWRFWIGYPAFSMYNWYHHLWFVFGLVPTESGIK